MNHEVIERAISSLDWTKIMKVYNALDLYIVTEDNSRGFKSFKNIYKPTEEQIKKDLTDILNLVILKNIREIHYSYWTIYWIPPKSKDEIKMGYQLDIMFTPEKSHTFEFDTISGYEFYLRNLRYRMQKDINRADHHILSELKVMLQSCIDEENYEYANTFQKIINDIEKEKPTNVDKANKEKID